jgi:hypothetical protein
MIGDSLLTTRAGIGARPTIVLADPVFETDFSQRDFTAAGWSAEGAWDVFQYPDEVANNPRLLARFAANLPDEGRLTKHFDEVSDPQRLVLSLDYGWGWGDAAQGADSECITCPSPPPL